MAINKI